MLSILENMERGWCYSGSSHRTNGISVRCQQNIGVIGDRHDAVLRTWIANQQHPKPRARFRQTNGWLLVLPYGRHSELQEWCIETWWGGRRKDSWKQCLRSCQVFRDTNFQVNEHCIVRDLQKASENRFKGNSTIGHEPETSTYQLVRRRYQTTIVQKDLISFEETLCHWGSAARYCLSIG